MDKKENTISLFTASFKQGFISPNVPLVTIHQGTKEFIFLLDSGSEYNVIDKTALENIDYVDVQDKSMPNTLSGVGGKVEVSACKICFRCGENEYTENFVVNDLSAAFRMIKQECGVIMHGIIGSKFLRDNNVVLDFQNLYAYSKDDSSCNQSTAAVSE